MEVTIILHTFPLPPTLCVLHYAVPGLLTHHFVPGVVEAAKTAPSTDWQNKEPVQSQGVLRGGTG